VKCNISDECFYSLGDTIKQAVDAERVYSLGYGLDSPEFEDFPFPKLPHHLWDLPSLPLNAYRGSFREINGPGLESDHSPTSSAEVKNEWSYTSTPLVLLHSALHFTDIIPTYIILANNQLDALFHVFIYFVSLHVSSIAVLIIRRSNCINTSSGMISLCK